MLIPLVRFCFSESLFWYVLRYGHHLLQHQALLLYFPDMTSKGLSNAGLLREKKMWHLDQRFLSKESCYIPAYSSTLNPHVGFLTCEFPDVWLLPPDFSRSRKNWSSLHVLSSRTKTFYIWDNHTMVTIFSNLISTPLNCQTF